MNYYENENGVDIREWLIEVNPELWAKISMFNALKYHVRAGKKKGEPELKDLKKKHNYLEDYAKVTKQTFDGAVSELHINARAFYDYDKKFR